VISRKTFADGSKFSAPPSPIRIAHRDSIAGRRCGASATRRWPHPAARHHRGAPRSESRASAKCFLKRFSKRYVVISAYHLLRALALAEQIKLGAGALGAGSPSTHQQIRRPAVFSRRLDAAGHGSLVSTTGFSNATSLAVASAQPPAGGAASNGPSRASLKTGAGRSAHVRRLRHCPHRLRRMGCR